MKVRCEGYEGWWRVCPVPGPTLPPGQLFWDQQAHMLATVAVLGLVLLVLTLVAFVAMLAAAAVDG